MGKRPGREFSIDRINVDGDYEPSNCKWATNSEQAKNKRNNVRITIDGITKLASEWAEETGVSLCTILYRHKSGWTGPCVISAPKGSITHNGITDTYAGWSKRTGLKASTIAMRIKKYKWPVERALIERVKL